MPGTGGLLVGGEYLVQAEDEPGGVEDEEHQHQHHHRLGQQELLRPLAARPVEPLGLGHLGVDLKKGDFVIGDVTDLHLPKVLSKLGILVSAPMARKSLRSLSTVEICFSRWLGKINKQICYTRANLINAANC